MMITKIASKLAAAFLILTLVVGLPFSSRVLAATGKLSVVIKNADGKGVQGARLRLYYQDKDVTGNPVVGGEVTDRYSPPSTNINGAVSWDLAPGTYVLAVWDITGYTRIDFNQVVSAGSTTTFALTLGRFCVVIKNADGKGVQGARLRLYYQDKDVTGNPVVGGELTDRYSPPSTNINGVLTWDFLAPRAYVLKIGSKTIFDTVVRAGGVTMCDGSKVTLPGGSTVVPSPPSGLSATPTSNFQAVLAWTDHADDENGFRIERKVPGGAYTEVGTVATNVASYSDSGLAPNTTYSYRVRSYNAQGNSDYSNEATATTKIEGGTIPDTLPPALVITSPMDGTTTTFSQITLHGIVTDAGSGLNYVEVNGVRASVSSGSFTASVMLTPDANTVVVTAVDVAGNEVRKTITLTYQQGTVLVLTVGKTIASKNGDTVHLDTSPVIANGRTLVPLRFIAEAFGIDPIWDGTLKTIKLALSGDRILTMQIGKSSCFMEWTGTSRTDTARLDSPPTITSGRTLVPIRFISEQLGADVVWDSIARTVTITWMG